MVSHNEIKKTEVLPSCFAIKQVVHVSENESNTKSSSFELASVIISSSENGLNNDGLKNYGKINSMIFGHNFVEMGIAKVCNGIVFIEDCLPFTKLK